jgi:hypothetical protein
MVQPCNGILFNQKKEWTSDTCCKHGSWQHYVMWANPDTKDHILHNSIYKKVQRSHIYTNRK